MTVSEYVSTWYDNLGRSALPQPSVGSADVQTGDPDCMTAKSAAPAGKNHVQITNVKIPSNIVNPALVQTLTPGNTHG